MKYEYVPYPKWIYLNGESKLVQDEQEHKQYPNWTESPAETVKEEEAPKRGRPRKVE